jgi:endoglucanase
MSDLNRRSLVGSMAGAPLWIGGPTPSGLRLSRGINVHHVVSWPDHVGKNPVQYRWPAYAGLRFDTAPETLQTLKRLGFDFIRFGVDPGIFLANESRRAELMKTLVSRVRPFLSAGLNIVFDLHPTKDNPAYMPDRFLIAGSPDFAKYVTFVRDMAATVNGLPQNRVALEMLNEPPMAGAAGIRTWQQMLETLHASARAAAPRLPLVMTGCDFGGLEELMKLDVSPFRGSNVLYTFHYYDPHIFTHQGIDTPTDLAHYVRNLRWPPRPSEQDAVKSIAAAGIDGHATLDGHVRARIKHSLDYQTMVYFRKANGPERIASDFKKLADWARSRNIDASRIFMGEFGARRPETDSPSLRADRIVWVQTTRKASEANGFGWSYWDLKGGGNWNLLADGTRTDFDPNMTRALGLNT